MAARCILAAARINDIETKQIIHEPLRTEDGSGKEESMRHSSHGHTASMVALASQLAAGERLFLVHHIQARLEGKEIVPAVELVFFFFSYLPFRALLSCPVG